MNGPTKRQWITVTELSTRVGVSVSTLRRWVRGGRLPAIQPGGPRGKLLFPADVVERIAQALRLPDVADVTQPHLDKVAPLSGPRPNWM
jgi:excisionase family DNA binding protein